RSGHTVIATSTGSGKSAALWTPALAAIDEPFELGRVTALRSRPAALYLAPTKALAADQLANLRALFRAAEVSGVQADACDGDTPIEARRFIQAHADIVASNPDFLHFSLLPGHQRWSGLLRGLRYVIVDELHAYRGVLGAHVAWVIRRLRRLAAHYGADPIFLAASGTVNDPGLTFARLIGAAPDQVTAVTQDTAERGERTLVFWRPAPMAGDPDSASLQPASDQWELPSPASCQPVDDAVPAPNSDRSSRDGATSARRPDTLPLADASSASDQCELPARRSAPSEAARLLADLAGVGARTVVFVRSRYSAEAVAAEARGLLDGVPASRVATYRGGYLPEERRELERRLRDGSLLGLVSTSALELGIDVAGLDAVLIAGWPGTLVALRQQAGRSGRAGSDGLAVWIAGSDPLDCYIAEHPETVVGAALEAAVFDPVNPYVMAPHLAAAAAELPLGQAEAAVLDGSAPAVLESLAAAGALRRRGDHWFWVLAGRAAELTDLRGSGGGLVQLVEQSTGQILGTVDSGRAPAAAHPGAVYTHQGKTFLVSELDLDGGVALVGEASPRYRTMPLSATTVRVVEDRLSCDDANATWHFGMVDVTSQVTSYMRLGPKGRRLEAETPAGRGSAPDRGSAPNSPPADAAAPPPSARPETERPNSGPAPAGGFAGWGQRIDTVPLNLPSASMRTAATWVTIPEATLAAAGLAPADTPGALHAAEHAAIGLLGLLATCDRWDLGGLSTPLHPDTEAATIFIHDAIAGGAGFAERAYHRRADLLRAVRDRLAACGCDDGCPSCVQSPKCGNANQVLSKPGALALVQALLAKPSKC
ncbi:MAG: DUF1998 domain-containing protein, partial [Bifidobacteriaceae bacterium]|nr:DUF1998 domain-containing protein [Bifidobacteriaceae bacterium]